LVGVETEWEKEQCEASGKQEHARKIKLDCIMFNGLHCCSTAIANGNQACFLGFAVIVDEEGE
jgi:hypothetical protein